MTRERQSQESGRAVYDHDEFRILCAISISGCMTEDEERRLRSHLADCGECRRFVAEYGSVAASAMPSLVSDFPEETAETPRGWSVEASKRKLFQRLELEDHPVSVLKAREERVRHRDWRWPLSTRSLLPYAAGLAAILAVATFSYRLGSRRSHDSAPVISQVQVADGVPQDPVSESNQRLLLQEQLEKRERAIASLNGKIAQQVAEIQGLNQRYLELEASLQRAESHDAHTVTERDDLGRKLELAQSDLAAAQKDIDALHQERAEQPLRLSDLQAQVTRLSEMLKARDATVNEQRELLARDKDIVELIGARHMYVGEVYDVASNAETKKPFGRVFYTKGKSLIFYAYDLDQQPHAHEASTFQVWGRRGPDLSQSMNLGTLYQDSSAHKRWVLKFDDTKFLDQIDAVFVTAEPQGGSRKPTGKGFLFTFLRVEPNHP
jgi:hypothetical protein